MRITAKNDERGRAVVRVDDDEHAIAYEAVLDGDDVDIRKRAMGGPLLSVMTMPLETLSAMASAFGVRADAAPAKRGPGRPRKTPTA
jgi:hypothetical protein